MNADQQLQAFEAHVKTINKGFKRESSSLKAVFAYLEAHKNDRPVKKVGWPKDIPGKPDVKYLPAVLSLVDVWGTTSDYDAESHAPPRELVDFRRHSLLKIARETRLGENPSGVCEGLCAVWIKYAAHDQGEAFVTRMKKPDGKLCDEIVDAQLYLTKLKGLIKQQNTKVGDPIRAEVARTLAETKEGRDFIQKHGLDDNSKLELNFSKMTGEDQAAALALAEKMKQAHDKMSAAEAKADALVSQSATLLWEKANKLHGLKDAKPLQNGQTVDLCKSLAAMLRANVGHFLFLRFRNNHEGEPGHAVAFFAGSKGSTNDVAFIDANSSLFQFSGIEACHNWFAGYWAETYKKYPADHYDYQVL